MSSRLQSSASYKAYIELDGLPLGSVEWAKDDDENYIIPLGEIKCHILVGDELCGKTYKSRGALKTHVTKDHRKNAASAQATGNPSNQQQEAAQIMYSAIMKKHINLFPTASEPVPNPSVPNTPKSNNPASNGTTSEHNGNKSGRASKRNSGGGTSSQDDINKFGKAPNGKPKMKLPEYKKANKKVGIKKGDVNFRECAKLVKEYENPLIYPCSNCKRRKTKATSCMWDKRCLSCNYFYGWETDEDEDEDEDEV